MNCNFSHQDGQAVCNRCGRTVRAKTARIIAECWHRGGPGTELSSILAGWPFYVQATEGCSCKKHAKVMDQWGCDMCEARMSEIVGWLKEEATKRGLPFVEVLARGLVRRAICRARTRLG